MNWNRFNRANRPINPDLNKQRYFVEIGKYDDTDNPFTIYDAVINDVIFKSSFTDIKCLCDGFNKDNLLYIRAVMEYCY